MEQLFPYQQTGAVWLAGKRRALLADEMGLGKSAQAIAACDDVLASRVCVVCPAVARINWEREFRKFSSAGRVFRVGFSGRDTPGKSESCILSYDLAVRFQAQETLGRFDVLILDEEHFLKNPTAKRTRAILGKKGLVHQADYVWALTGTPMPNGDPRELWPLLFTFGRTKLSYFDFGARFCNWLPGAGPTSPLPRAAGTNPRHKPELRELLQPVMLRRRKVDVLQDLPPITFGDVVVERTDVDLKANASFFQYALDKDGPERLMKELALSQMRLKTEMDAVGQWTPNYLRMLEAMAPSVSTLRRYVGLQKVPAVAEMLRYELELGAYDKIVVFAIHRDAIEGLRARLADFGAVTLYGKTDPETRQRNIDRFQTNDKYRVFIANIQAAGTAITLTRAQQILILEPSWVPSENAQAIMRVHRIGQKERVLCRFVHLTDSIDEKIGYVLKRKTRDIVSIVDGDDTHLKSHEKFD